MHLEALLIGNVSCKLYIQNPRHPEISLVLITLCPRNIILVYLACETFVTLYNLVINHTQYDFSHGHYAASERNSGLAGYMWSVPGDLQSKETNVNNIFLIHSSLKSNINEQYNIMHECDVSDACFHYLCHSIFH